MLINRAELNLEHRLAPSWRKPARFAIAIVANALVALLLVGASRALDILIDHTVGGDTKLLFILTVDQALRFADISILILFVASTLLQLAHVSDLKD